MENSTDDTKLPPTASLIDIENAEHMKKLELKAQKLSKVANEIADILVREDMTWGEWGEVVELFSAKIGVFVSNVKINFPK